MANAMAPQLITRPAKQRISTEASGEWDGWTQQRPWARAPGMGQENAFSRSLPCGWAISAALNAVYEYGGYLVRAVVGLVRQPSRMQKDGPHSDAERRVVGEREAQ